jgi:hypothetical protein
MGRYTLLKSSKRLCSAAAALSECTTADATLVATLVVARSPWPTAPPPP